MYIAMAGGANGVGFDVLPVGAVQIEEPDFQTLAARSCEARRKGGGDLGLMKLHAQTADSQRGKSCLRGPPAFEKGRGVSGVGAGDKRHGTTGGGKWPAEVKET